MFMDTFPARVTVGDFIECQTEGLTVRATIERDCDTKPEDDACFDHISDDVLASWLRDEWFFCDVVLSVYRDGVLLLSDVARANAMEANFPNAPQRNVWLYEAAGQLLRTALDAGHRVP